MEHDPNNPQAGDNLVSGVPMGIRADQRGAVATPTTDRELHAQRFRRAARHLISVIERRWQCFPDDLVTFNRLGNLREAWFRVMCREAEKAGLGVIRG